MRAASDVAGGGSMGRNHVGNCSIDDVMTPDLDLPPADLGLPPKPMEAPLSARAWHGVQDFIAGLVGIADQSHSQPPSHPVAATIISKHWRRRCAQKSFQERCHAAGVLLDHFKVRTAQRACSRAIWMAVHQDTDRIRAATKIQAVFRGLMDRHVASLRRQALASASEAIALPSRAQKVRRAFSFQRKKQRNAKGPGDTSASPRTDAPLRQAHGLGSPKQRRPTSPAALLGSISGRSSPRSSSGESSPRSGSDVEGSSPSSGRLRRRSFSWGRRSAKELEDIERSPPGTAGSNQLSRPPAPSISARARAAAGEPAAASVTPAARPDASPPFVPKLSFVELEAKDQEGAAALDALAC